MKLFRRLLLSLFPKELTLNAQHPISMFLSLISPKQFFSIIHRKVTENFKLNLYDIALDPFEIKVGFWEQPTLQVKDIDKYYAYWCVAQLNGNNFYSPGNLALAASMAVAVESQKIAKKYLRSYMYVFLMTVYFLSFIFVARVRVFPNWDKQEQYKRFLELFFSFYDLVAQQFKSPIEPLWLQQFKEDLLRELQLFFFLFYFYKKLNSLFYSSTITDKDFYARLFSEELKHKDSKATIEQFLLHRYDITASSTFWWWDIQLCTLILPTDAWLKYLLQGDEWYYVIEYLLPKVFSSDYIHTQCMSFLKNGDSLDTFIQSLLDRERYQGNFFQWMQEISHRYFRLENDYETNQEIDAFISHLESWGQADKTQIPERLKQESAMTERLMNFYISFVGGLWTGRWDWFALRLFKKEFIESMMHLCGEDHLKQEALQYYGALLYAYSKNLFYYSYAYENIRAGKQVFRLPYKSWYKEVYSNMYLLRMFDENALCSLFQDICPGSLTITVTQKDIVVLFKNLLHDRIQRVISWSKDDILMYFYGSVSNILHQEQDVTLLLKQYITDAEYSLLKEQCYSFDLHVWVHATELLQCIDWLQASYGKIASIGLLAMLRETLFGFLLYTNYLQSYALEQWTTVTIHAFKQLYILDILHIAPSRVPDFLELIDSLLIAYHPLLNLWMKLDDNMQYFALGVENWLLFIDKKTTDQILSDTSGDDIVRCRGFLKSISYYNKRIVRPS